MQPFNRLSPLSPVTMGVLAMLSMSSTGCVSLLTEGNSEANFASAKRDHVYGFYLQQTHKLRDLAACQEAALYFDKVTNPKTSNGFGGSSRSSQLKDEDVATLQERIVTDARALLGDCEKGAIVSLEAGRQWERLANTLKALAVLPVGDADQQRLLRRADTVGLLHAKAVAADGEKSYAEAQFYKALSELSQATSIANGVKSATDDEKNVFRSLEQKYKGEYVKLMLSKAKDAELHDETRHLALLYTARAFEVSRDKSIGARLDGLRQALRATSAYAWKVEFKGDAGITRAAQQRLQSHQFSGNYKAGVPRELVAVIDVGAFAVTPVQKDGSRSGQYVTGSKTVDNPEYRKLNDFVMRQQRCISNLGSVSWGTNQVARDQTKLGCDYWNTGRDSSRRENTRRMNDAQARLSKTSMTIQEDLMASWSYPTTEWSQTIKAPVQLSLKTALDHAPKPSTFTLEHIYADHAHDLVPKLGLGAKTITKKTDAELAADAGAKLGQMVIETVEGDYKKWLIELPKLGDRGAVLYMVLNSDGQKLNKQIEDKTGLKDAHRLANLR